MKVTISGFVTMHPRRSWEAEKGPRFDFYTFDPRGMQSFDGAVVCEHTMQAEVPDDFDPRPGMVAALEAQKAKVRAELAARVKELDDRIQSLLAIECSEVTQ